MSDQGLPKIVTRLPRLPLLVRSRRILADVHDAEPITDRAGNPRGRLVVWLLPGTELTTEYEGPPEAAPRPCVSVQLAEPIPVNVEFDPHWLAEMALRAMRSKTGRCKTGPLVAKRTVSRGLVLKRVPRT